MKTFFVVTILSFNKNTHSDYFSCDDLFTYVAYGDQKRRTITKWNQVYPEWNEDLVFVFSEEVKNIKIAVMDEDRWSPSEKVWERSVPIKKENIGKIIEIDNLLISYDVCIMNSFKSIVQDKKEELDKFKMVMTQLDEIIENKQTEIQDLEISNIHIYKSGLIN